ncbi:class I SAM-dependent methyltransferase [Gemmiger sp. An120]|uniref:class I SAM-dependent methyltransferase n=1 Tax=Gemmiger sp. An120 TaxID=1965549 RepID=UPI001302212C|nr:class I SAM-dependent methyltransferase [Gemmiger sp. An120]
MLKAFLENCKRPQGGFGRLILRGMNNGHGPVAGWAFDRMEWPVNGRILDIGCGGGGNIARLLRRLPGCRVDGVDYSGESVAVSRRVNARQADRCRVVRGDVMALPFADASYDAALAVETVYFWPDLTAGLREAARVLRPGGALLVVTEMSDPQKGAVWSHNCPGMTIYTPAQLRAALEAAGFSVTVYTKGVWTAAVGQKQN